MDINFSLYSLCIHKIYFVHSKILWNIYPMPAFRDFCVFEDILEHYFVQLKKILLHHSAPKGRVLLSILPCSLTS